VGLIGRWPFGRRKQVAQAEAPPRALTGEDHDKLRLLLTLTNDLGQPNINELLVRVRDLDALALNVKAFGYRLARELSGTLHRPPIAEPIHVGLGSKLSTQADLESDWARYWFSELQIAPLMHRKLWEFAWALQVLHDAGCLRPGQRGVGFGCGMETLSSYFARCGVDVVTTDLPPDDARATEWMRNNEYAPVPEAVHDPRLVDKETFLRRVRHRYVDMNAVPDDLTGFDFCWSICALEHLGSIEQGLQFIERSLDCLVPGGTAVHTTEFNIDPFGPTIDNWLTVFFQQGHMDLLEQRLAAKGHRVATFDFNPGDKPLDQFIDLPPWHDSTKGILASALGQSHHLKVAADGFVVTCIGIAITKAG
jgi:hypothetical protein